MSKQNHKNKRLNYSLYTLLDKSNIVYFRQINILQKNLQFTLLPHYHFALAVYTNLDNGTPTLSYCFRFAVFFEFWRVRWNIILCKWMLINSYLDIDYSNVAKIHFVILCVYGIIRLVRFSLLEIGILHTLNINSIFSKINFQSTGHINICTGTNICK